MVPNKEEERKALLLSLFVFAVGMTIFLAGCAFVVLIDFWGGDVGGILLLLMGLWVMLVAFKKDVDEEELIASAGPSQARPVPAGRYPQAGTTAREGRALRSYPADPSLGGPRRTGGPWRYPEHSTSRWESRRGTSWRFFHRDVMTLAGEQGFQLSILVMGAILLLINAIILAGMMDFETMTMRDAFANFFLVLVMMDILFPVACIIYWASSYWKLYNFKRTYG